MRDVLPTLERWAGEGSAAAVAILAGYERSSPREPGAAFAVSSRGEVAGTITAGCVEPALVEEASSVLAGSPARLVSYGIADEDAFEVGLPCGGTVHVLVAAVRPSVVDELASAVRDETPAALLVAVRGEGIGAMEVVVGSDAPCETTLDGDRLVVALPPRPALYVVGAIEHASALATLGRLLGYRVTVVDPRARFATRERVPDADELVVDWPDRYFARTALDERAAVCVLTHDPKIDVPALRAALASPARYIGAMGSRRTTERRTEHLRAEGVAEEDIARIRAPIGLGIGSKTPAEVAVAIGAELVAVARGVRPGAIAPELLAR